eukprot:227295-Lingulodinium_polyedra.AAC.1
MRLACNVRHPNVRPVDPCVTGTAEESVWLCELGPVRVQRRFHDCRPETRKYPCKLPAVSQSGEADARACRAEAVQTSSGRRYRAQAGWPGVTHDLLGGGVAHDD